MSGNIWKFSDQIDDEDVLMLGRYFITYQMASEYYGLGMKPLVRLAKEAGAVYKIGKMARLRRELLEAHLRKVQRK